MDFTVEKGSEKGSQKAVSRRCLERPLVEYTPLGVRPAGHYPAILMTGHIGRNKHTRICTPSPGTTTL